MTYLVSGLSTAGRILRTGLPRDEAEAIAQQFVDNNPGAMATVDDEREGRCVALFRSDPTGRHAPRNVEMPVRRRA